MNSRMTQLKEKMAAGKKIFSGFITYGYPAFELTPVLMNEMADNGCDLIELGVPFSDPIADGPTIQKASQTVLARNHPALDEIMTAVKTARKKLTIPVVLMGYANVFFTYGYERFAKKAKSAGIDGVLIVDMPLEESAEFEPVLRKHSLSFIRLVSPVSGMARAGQIARKSDGFIYLVSYTGITGALQKLQHTEAAALCRHMKRITDNPVLVGFGIAAPKDAKVVLRYADGFVVGSAILRHIEKQSGQKNFLKSFGRYIRTFAQAAKKPLPVKNKNRCRSAVS